MAATITFEQSYGGIDGDSASTTELYALLSALSGLPLNQGIAVTGAVNQHGEVQAVGGVTRKIEGFYDVCRISTSPAPRGTRSTDRIARKRAQASARACSSSWPRILSRL